MVVNSHAPQSVLEGWSLPGPWGSRYQLQPEGKPSEIWHADGEPGRPTAATRPSRQKRSRSGAARSAHTAAAASSIIVCRSEPAEYSGPRGARHVGERANCGTIPFVVPRTLQWTMLPAAMQR